jgi:hypothetical protein
MGYTHRPEAAAVVAAEVQPAPRSAYRPPGDGGTIHPAHRPPPSIAEMLDRVRRWRRDNDPDYDED